MQIEQLQSMTVIQLRKLAKENGVKLSAGIDKAGIVEKVAEKAKMQERGRNGQDFVKSRHMQEAR